MRSKLFINRLRNENGQVLVLVALLMTVIMGFAAFAVDIGRVTVVKSKLQNAADAAALAGAAAYNDNPKEIAKSYAMLNGIDEDDITVNLNVVLEKAHFESMLSESEIRNNLENMEEEELISFAVKENLDEYLEVEVKKKYTTEQIEEEIQSIKDNELETVTSEILLKFASDNSFIIPEKYLSGKPSSIKDKDLNEVIELLLNLKRDALNDEVITTTKIKDGKKSSLIDKLVEIYMKPEEQNGAQGNKKLVEVKLKRNVKYTFARILGFDDTTVTARAVAERKGFDGGVLPFTNFDPYQLGEELVLWDKEGSGNKERLLTLPHVIIYEFDPEVGAEHANGKVANIKDELKKVCTDGATVYILSLSNDIMIEGNDIPIIKNYGKNNQTYDSFKYPEGNVGQGNIIESQYLVLLKCTVKHYDDKTVKVLVDEIYEDLTPVGIESIKGSVLLVE